jgi:putative ABC transport system ATP-binding protein
MVSIMGPSGCGKTTLLNCLSGLDDFDGGDVRIAGTSLKDMNDNQKTDYRARKMGFVFQVYNLLPVLSAVENVELPLLVSGMHPRQARKKALAALDTVQLVSWAGHRPAELSGGQRQRVTVARSLVNEPAIVWADEPTGALDSEAAAGIMDLMCRLNKQNGQTFVVVTHAMEVGERADRIVRMRDGHVEDRRASGYRTGVLRPGSCDWARMEAGDPPVTRSKVSTDDCPGGLACSAAARSATLMTAASSSPGSVLRSPADRRDLRSDGSRRAP